MYASLQKKQAVNEDGIQISLDPSNMELDEGALAEKYEEQLRKQTRSNDDQEDLTDMVAEHSAKQNVRCTGLSFFYSFLA